MTSPLKNTLMTLTALAGTTLLVACGSTPEPGVTPTTVAPVAEAATTEPTDDNPYPNGSLNLALFAAMDSVPIFLAYEKGFFADHGVDVSIERFFSAQDRDTSFQVDDSFDGLIFDGVALAIYNDAGFDIVGVTSTIGLTSVIGANHVETITDIAGEHTLISFNTSMDYIIHAAMDTYGIDPATVTLQGIPQLPVRLEMLLADQAGAATLAEPMASIAVEVHGLNRLTSTPAMDINPFVMGFRRSSVENYPDALAAFFRGWNDAVDFMATAPREAFMHVLADIAGFPEDMMDTLEIPSFGHAAMPAHHHMQDVFDFAYERGIVETHFDAAALVSDFLN